jgi:hypothetical protein
MSRSVWLYVNPNRESLKVFDSWDAALDWLRKNDPDGIAVEWPVEEGPSPSEQAKRTDYQTLVEAFWGARDILADYVEDGKAYRAVGDLMKALLNDRVVTAISRIERRHRFAVIHGDRSSAPDHAG